MMTDSILDIFTAHKNDECDKIKKQPIPRKQRANPIK